MNVSCECVCVHAKNTYHPLSAAGQDPTLSPGVTTGDIGHQSPLTAQLEGCAWGPTLPSLPGPSPLPEPAAGSCCSRWGAVFLRLGLGPGRARPRLPAGPSVCGPAQGPHRGGDPPAGRHPCHRTQPIHPGAGTGPQKGMCLEGTHGSAGWGETTSYGEHSHGSFVPEAPRLRDTEFQSTDPPTVPPRTAGASAAQPYGTRGDAANGIS